MSVPIVICSDRFLTVDNYWRPCSNRPVAFTTEALIHKPVDNESGGGRLIVRLTLLNKEMDIGNVNS